VADLCDFGAGRVSRIAADCRKDLSRGSVSAEWSEVKRDLKRTTWAIARPITPPRVRAWVIAPTVTAVVGTLVNG
jgi:hypothetical protein